jgi:hypothetical protein
MSLQQLKIDDESPNALDVKWGRHADGASVVGKIALEPRRLTPGPGKSEGTFGAALARVSASASSRT